MNYFTAASDRHSFDWTRYDEVGSRSPNDIQLSNAGKGYALLGPPEEPSPMLSANEVTAGYTLLGSPAQPGAVANAHCPLRPDSAYAEVRNEGQNFAPAKMSAPSQTVCDDYSLVGFPSSGEETEPIPISGRYEVRMIGYWPKSLFGVSMDNDGVEVHKHTTKE